jgi:hypothetical protein
VATDSTWPPERMGRHWTGCRPRPGLTHRGVVWIKEAGDAPVAGGSRTTRRVPVVRHRGNSGLPDAAGLAAQPLSALDLPAVPAAGLAARGLIPGAPPESKGTAQIPAKLCPNASRRAVDRALFRSTPKTISVWRCRNSWRFRGCVASDRVVSLRAMIPEIYFGEKNNSIPAKTLRLR